MQCNVSLFLFVTYQTYKTIIVKKIFKAGILFILIISSCKKLDDKNRQNTSTVCFKPNFINTNLPDNFLSIFFINSKDGFVGGSSGSIYKTTDSSKSWVRLNSTINLPIRGIYFIDNNIGFAVGGENSCDGSGCTPAGSFILRTQDGGQTWSKVFSPSDKIEISSVYFINSATGFCAGDNAVFKTIDGGQTWLENKINIPGIKMMKISFIDNQTGFIVCLFDKILKTSNGGNTWEISSPNKNVGYYSFSSSNGVSYVSGQGKILKSVNTGDTWTELINSPTDIFDVKFIDENIGYAFGRGNYSGGDFGRSYGAMYCTNNGGETWDGNGDFAEVGLIQSSSFPGKNIGYAVSGNIIIKIEEH